ncbi:MAG TPA: glycoside hydrolase family 3 N-terminal domain-containing protein [Treponemataceae bacterium]|nr:glycoside hydrolase family 3 N-terminal domain-containing protein [Treponemataceae bacterium]
MRYLRFLTLIIILFSLFSCGKESGTEQDFSSAPEKIFVQNERFQAFLEQRAIDNYLDSFSLKQKLSQLFIINLEGSSNYTASHDYNELFCPGGFIFFSYNIGKTAETLMGFTDSILDYYKTDIPPFLSLDLEGGEVNRLRNIISPLPSAEEISQLFTAEEAALFYKEIAKQSHLLGISLNLAPIVEPLLEENAAFLKTRSFGSIEKTKFFSLAFIESFNSEGVLCTLKHFPGNTDVDPHLNLPVLALNKEDFEKNMLAPFRFVLENQKNNNAVLLSHALIPFISDLPASLSSEVVDLLVKDLDYSGLIITDDIFMAALQSFFSEEKDAILLALDAGAHILLSSKKVFTQFLPFLEEIYTTETVYKEKIDIALQRIIRAKIEAGLLGFSERESWSSLCLLKGNTSTSIDKIDQIDRKERERLFYEAKKNASEILSEAYQNNFF